MVWLDFSFRNTFQNRMVSNSASLLSQECCYMYPLGRVQDSVYPEDNRNLPDMAKEGLVLELDNILLKYK